MTKAITIRTKPEEARVRQNQPNLKNETPGLRNNIQITNAGMQIKIFARFLNDMFSP